MTKTEHFGLVFLKTGSLNSGYVLGLSWPWCSTCRGSTRRSPWACRTLWVGCRAPGPPGRRGSRTPQRPCTAPGGGENRIRNNIGTTFFKSTLKWRGRRCNLASSRKICFSTFAKTKALYFKKLPNFAIIAGESSYTKQNTTFLSSFCEIQKFTTIFSKGKKCIFWPLVKIFVLARFFIFVKKTSKVLNIMFSH
jgi:hypothetical protein